MFPTSTPRCRAISPAWVEDIIILVSHCHPKLKICPRVDRLLSLSYHSDRSLKNHVFFSILTSMKPVRILKVVWHHGKTMRCQHSWDWYLWASLLFDLCEPHFSYLYDWIIGLIIPACLIGLLENIKCSRVCKSPNSARRVQWVLNS